MPESPQSSAPALPSARSAKRSPRERMQWALTGLGLALLVLLVLPSAQIKLGASHLHGLIGSYTSNGSYSVVYSGGTTTINTNPPTNYSANTSVNAPGAWGGGDNAYGTGAVSANCAGQIAAAFTWNPGPNNAPAPPAGSVIVTETASAAWSGPGSTGSCGLPNPTKSATAPNETGTRYSVQGGGSFSVNCTPTASLSVTGPGGGQVIGGSVYVGYAATASPATISLGGSIPINGAQTALTGQQIVASIAFSNGSPAGATVTNYQWTVQGQNATSIVGGYTTTQKSGFTTPIGPLTGSSASSITFYDGMKDSVTVKGTETLMYADKTTGTLTASAILAFVKPTVTQPSKFALTEVDNFNPSHLYDTSSQMGVQATWTNVTITMPHNFSVGTGCFAQMINSTSRTDSRKTGVPYTEKVQTSSGAWASVPAPCLDTNFPYPFANPWNVTSTGSGGDVPSFLVSPPVVAGDPGHYDWNKATGGDHFTTWVMYTPDSTLTTDIWVPLGSFDWNWSDTADYQTITAPPGWAINVAATVGNPGTIAPNDNWPTWATYALSGNTAMRP